MTVAVLRRQPLPLDASDFVFVVSRRSSVTFVVAEPQEDSSDVQDHDVFVCQLAPDYVDDAAEGEQGLCRKSSGGLAPRS